MADSTGRNSDKFMLRLPDGMRDRIKTAAAESGRSMNAEIVATLEEKYPDKDQELDQILAMLLQLKPDDRERLLTVLMKKQPDRISEVLDLLANEEAD